MVELKQETRGNDKTIGPILFQIMVVFLLVMIFYAIGENTRVQRELNNSLNPQVQEEITKQV